MRRAAWGPLSTKPPRRGRTPPRCRLLSHTAPIRAPACSSEAPPPRPNIAQLPHFITHRDNPAAGLFVAPPFRSAATGNWITAASRRLNNPDGSFAGVVTAALDQSYFASTYRAIRLDNGGAAVLIHRDGPIMAREPMVKDVIGKNFSG